MRVLVRQVRGRGRKPNWRNAAREVERTIDAELMPRIVKYTQNFVKGWDHKPEFKVTKQITTKALAVRLKVSGPNAKYWNWTSRGTKKHKIPKRRKPGQKPLAFPSTYTPHTRPRGPSYGGPGESSGETVIVAQVVHPGTKPRHFEEAIGRWIKMTNVWSKGIENAIRRGLRK